MKAIKKKNISETIVILFIIILFNILASFVFLRVDLTTEKRYSISDSSKEVLKNLDHLVFIKVYLDGDLNIAFKRMKKRIRELLDEFKIYGEEKFEYIFVNPSASDDPKVRDEIYQDLYEKGLKPSNIHYKDKEGGITEKIIFPGALIVYDNVEVPVNLLKNNPSLSGEENINNSIQTLEYEFLTMLHTLTSKEVEKVAFLEGHGELDESQVGDISRDLSRFYQVDRGHINGQQGILDSYKALIIAKPQKKFSEEDKFILDQYIMNGGKVLWFIDRVKINMDSLSRGNSLVFIQDLNISDMLFRYGIRINPVLLQDYQCNIIPVNTALPGNPAKFSPVPWLYFPLLTPPKGNPITNNVNLIKTEFANTIDTLGARKGVKKTALLTSSFYARKVNTPTLVSLDEIKLNIPKEQFKDTSELVAVLLEGTFESVFTHRILAGLSPKIKVNFKSKSVPNKMLVVADGDMIRNDIKQTPQGTLVTPLGFDKYTGQTFGNKDFIINTLHYLTGKEGFIELRSREFTLRLLDRARINTERTRWQFINVIVPILLIIGFGLYINYRRKVRYTKDMDK